MMNKVKEFAFCFLSLFVLTGRIVSCTPALVIEAPGSNEQTHVATDVSQYRPTEQSANLKSTYGIQVVARSLCTDGVKTILSLQTNLDPEFWQLSENDFYPKGPVYYETSILFLENNEMYSTVSSGKREDPVFDARNNSVSTIQTFVFPRTPLPNSEFTLKANVWLGNLPAAYTPPAGMSLLESGAIEVPMEYVASASLGNCP